MDGEINQRFQFLDMSGLEDNQIQEIENLLFPGNKVPPLHLPFETKKIPTLEAKVDVKKHQDIKSTLLPDSDRVVAENTLEDDVKQGIEKVPSSADKLPTTALHSFKTRNVLSKKKRYREAFRERTSMAEDNNDQTCYPKIGLSHKQSTSSLEDGPFYDANCQPQMQLPMHPFYCNNQPTNFADYNMPSMQSSFAAEPSAPMMQAPYGTHPSIPRMQSQYGFQPSVGMVSNPYGSQPFVPIMQNVYGPQPYNTMIQNPSGPQSYGPIMSNPYGYQPISPYNMPFNPVYHLPSNMPYSSDENSLNPSHKYSDSSASGERISLQDYEGQQAHMQNPYAAQSYGPLMQPPYGFQPNAPYFYNVQPNQDCYFPPVIPNQPKEENSNSDATESEKIISSDLSVTTSDSSNKKTELII